MARKTAGRKLKLTPELAKELAEYIRQGLTNKTAIDSVGITDSTFYAWIRQGEADVEKGKDTIFSQFLHSIKKAESLHKIGRLNVIRKAANDGSWQAAAWELERRYRDEYGKNETRVELTGVQGGEPIKTESVVQVYLPSNGREVKQSKNGEK